MELPAHESMVGLAMTNRYRNATSGTKGALKCEKSGADVRSTAMGCGGDVLVDRTLPVRA
jgi:hypothetical protein